MGYRSGDEPIPSYRLIRFLGKGNFGEVWMATAPGNKKVALKIIDVRGREGLVETKAIERIKDINHPHLLSIFAYWFVNSDGQVIEDFSISKLTVGPPGGKNTAPTVGGTILVDTGEDDARPVALIVAMNLGAKNLSDVLEEYGKQGQNGIPIDALIDYTEDAAKGLDYLNAPIHDHGKGPKPIIHGDVKPQNLLIVGDCVQVCDFGLAREVDDLRKTATAMGTYAYAAPELLSGHPHVRSDQYCLAVTYMELRTGRLPLFGESSILKVAEMHRDGKLDFSGLGSGEREVLRRAAHPDPVQRWSTCREMVVRLRQAVERDRGGEGTSVKLGHDSHLKVTPPITIRDTAPLQLQKKHSVRRIVRRGAAITLLVALAFVAAWWWGPALWSIISGPHKYSPEWFAREFTKLGNSLPDPTDRSKTALKQTIDVEDKAKALIDLWSPRIEDELDQLRFAEAARFLAAVARESELDVSEKVGAERKRLEEHWADTEQKWVNSKNFAAAASVITEFRPESVFSAEEHRSFPSRDKVSTWQNQLCEQRLQTLVTEIDAQLKGLSNVIDLVENAERIDRIDALPQDAKVRIREKVKNYSIALLEKLSGPNQYDFAEALRQLSQIPPKFLPEKENFVVRDKLLDALSTRVRNLVSDTRDYSRAAELLHRCGNMADDRFRKNLGGELQPFWAGPVRKSLDVDKPQAAWEQLEKCRVLADELGGLPYCKSLADKIHNRWLAALRESYQKKFDALPDLIAELEEHFLKAFPDSDEGKLLLKEWKGFKKTDPIAEVNRLLKEVREGFDKGTFAEARGNLSKAEALLKATPHAAVSRQIGLWYAAITLSDSGSSPENRANAFTAAQEMLRSPTDDVMDAWRRLALAFASALLERRRPAEGEQLLPFALQVVRAACDEKCDPQTKAARAMPFAKLWEWRVELLVAAGELPQSPTKDEFGQFEADWKSLDDKAQGATRSALINAWRMECRCLDPDRPPDSNAQRPDGNEPYARYVRLLIDNAPDPQTRIKELTALFVESAGMGDKSWAALGASSRKKRAVEWAADAVDAFCKKHTGPGVLANPFDDTDNAQRCCKLLKTVHESMAAVPPTQSWTPDTKRRLLDHLATAAIFENPPDLPMAQQVTETWIHDRPRLDAAAELVLYAAVRSRFPHSGARPTETEDRDLVEVSVRLIHALADHLKRRNSGLIDKDSATTIYGKFLQPVLQRTKELLDRKLPAEQLRELGDFYVAAYDFVSQYRSADWPVANPSAWIDEMLDAAIKLKAPAPPRVGSAAPAPPPTDPELKRLYRDRAQRALGRDDPDLKRAISDARLSEASDLLADALGRHAEQQVTRKSILTELTQAIKEGRKAESAYGMMSLSTALVLWSNYNNDPGYTLEARKTDLAEAVAKIEQADRIRQTPGVRGVDEYLYRFGAGNAYEDLAWLVEMDPTKNMNRAIHEFAEAAKVEPRKSMPHCSIGRCYYKALAETFLPPQTLQKTNLDPLQNEEEVMTECENALNAAIHKDRELVEANDYLARLYQHRAEYCYGQYLDDSYLRNSLAKPEEWLAKSKQWYGKADDQYETTWKLAEKQGLLHRAFYAISWVVFPLCDRRYDLDKKKGQLLQRLELLERVPTPPGEVIDPGKCKALYRGQLAELERDYEKALSIYSDPLPKDLSLAACDDAQLLTARAKCRMYIVFKAAHEVTGRPSEKVIQEAENAFNDAVAAEKVAFYLNDKVNALEQAFNASVFAAMWATNENWLEMCGRSEKEITRLLVLGARRPDQYQWCREWARLLRNKMVRDKRAALPHSAGQLLKDHLKIIDWASSAVQLCKRKQEQDDLTANLLKRSYETAVDFAEDELKKPGQPPPDLKNKLDEWKEILRTMR